MRLPFSGLILTLAAAAASAGDGGEGPAPVPVTFDDREASLAEELIASEGTDFAGWATEALSAHADARLRLVGASLAGADPITGASVAALVTGGCVASHPGTPATAFDDGGLTVARAGEAFPLESRGAEALAAALEALRRPLGSPTGVRVRFKITGVEVADTGFHTRVIFHASRRSAGAAFQANAVLQIDWTLPAEDAPARMTRFAVRDLEAVELRREGGRLFSDVTASALAGEPSLDSQVLRGANHWLRRLTRRESLSIFGHHGLAVGDVDGDGLEDVYVCDDGGLPNRLYRQRPDGTVDDIAAAAGVDWVEPTSSALLVDLDGDGDQDLVAATYPNLIVAANDGQGRFTPAARYDVGDALTSLAAADHDGDGDLDVYVGVYSAPDGSVDEGRPEGYGTRLPLPYQDANNGGRNVLLRNDGELRFADVTDEVGLGENNTRFTFAASWEDFDDDGDLDLYVANDFGRNSLYRNDGGRFTDIAAAAGLEDLATGMSVAWGDYDRDGRPDLYVGNMFSGAGNRVAFQRRFTGHRPQEQRAQLQRTARGNSLFRSAGDGVFHDVSEAAGVTVGLWSWASPFADLNNDGWLDLVVANGFITGEDTGDL